MIVQNTNLNSFTALLDKDLFEDLYVLESKYINKNSVFSIKQSLNDINQRFQNDFINQNNTVLGNWTFKNNLSVGVSTNEKAIPNIFLTYVALEKLLSKIYELSANYFYFGKMQSYPGMVIATSLSSEELVIEKFRGKSWKVIANGRFIVGAEKANNDYGIPSSNDGSDTIMLNANQIGLDAHNHNFVGSVYAGNKNVNCGNMIQASIHQTQHSKAGGSKPCYSAELLQAYCQGVEAKTSRTYTFSGSTSSTDGDTGQTAVDNRPRYIPLYFWQRER